MSNFVAGFEKQCTLCEPVLACGERRCKPMLASGLAVTPWPRGNGAARTSKRGDGDMLINNKQ